MLWKPALLLFFAALTVDLVWAADATASAPTDQVRATVDRVLAILKDPKLNSADAKEARRQALRDAIYPRFDFEEMAKRSLGSEWRRRTPAERKEFVGVFTELLKNAYVESIESYHGDKVVYGRESQDRGYAEVDTVVTTEDGKEFTIDYRLHIEGSEWKVYDVIIENVSIVNNYRSQFSRILGRSSFADLLQKIRAKIQ